MIHYFPEPRLDEHWYSILARYKDHTGVSATAIRKLIRVPGYMKPCLGIIYDAHSFIEKIALNFNQTPETFVEKHTLIQYLLFGKKSQTAELILKGTLHKLDKPERMKLAHLLGRIAPAFRLALCPLCIKDDQLNHGEAYYHRMHTIGLERCHIHKCKLVRVNINRSQLLNFLSAEQFHLEHPEKFYAIKTSKPSNERLDQIYSDLFDLINGHWIKHEQTSLNEKYKTVLKDQNYVQSDGGLNAYDLNARIQYQFPTSTINHLKQYPILFRETDWLDDFQQLESNLQPIQHILLINYLGFDLKSFFFYQDGITSSLAIEDCELSSVSKCIKVMFYEGHPRRSKLSCGCTKIGSRIISHRNLRL